ncbi:hypothetical protein C7B70_12505 [Chlorogloea sp. CCALA 695]|nr:hypothetical protein C7B70_12505 [Chlorogloea sp. CCALA 695]
MYKTGKKQGFVSIRLGLQKMTGSERERYKHELKPKLLRLTKPYFIIDLIFNGHHYGTKNLTSQLGQL